MKRFSYVFLLMLLSSTAHAGGYSFSVGGHHVYVEAGRHCRSLSCVSWTELGTGRSHRDDDEVAPAVPTGPVAAAPACPSAPAATVPAASPPVAPAPSIVPAPVPTKPPVVVQAPAPSTIKLAAASAQPAPKPERATVEATVADKPVETPDWAKDWSPPRDAPAIKSAGQPTKVVAHADDSPVGDWRTEGSKGLVRIEKCGASLCGYLLDETTNTTGEIVLSNMKAKKDAQWAGDIYSRASGNTYFARMTFGQPDTLRVEACAIGHFLCSGNHWTRVPRSQEVATSRDLPAAPKT